MSAQSELKLATDRPMRDTGASMVPPPRGPVSGRLFDALALAPHRVAVPAVEADDPVGDEDLQLALYCCYELHYRGLAGVDEGWEWEPSLLELRRGLEGSFERALRSALPTTETTPEAVPDLLWDMTRRPGPSLSGWLLQQGTRLHAEELAIHRSAYQLKEADPHTWGLPRLTGRAKAAMLSIQSDEYGNGVTAEMHASLFADAVRCLGLDPTYGFYLDRLPAVTLATTNLVSMLGLHRRLRGALVGHLASFEMSSVGPMGRYSTWLASLGVPPQGRRFYDVHVEADAVHQHIAVDDLVGGLVESEPGMADEVLFGAHALGLVERILTEHLLECWAHGRSSLRAPPSEATPTG